MFHLSGKKIQSHHVKNLSGVPLIGEKEFFLKMGGGGLYFFTDKN
jgi:hypothetical protein